MGTDTNQIEIATAHYTKGRKLWSKGDRDNALALFRKALSIQEAVLGIYNKQTARTYYQVGFVLSYKKEFDKALVAYRRTLRIRLFLLGDDDVSSEDVKRALKDLLKKKGFNKDKVEQYLEGITTSVGHEKRGENYEGNGQYDQALEEYERCMAIEKQAIGAFPLDFARIYAKIASVYKKQGEYDMSIVAYRDALTILVARLGKNHTDCIACVEGIESAAYSKGVEEEMIEQYQQQVFGSIACVIKADKYRKDGDFQSAIEKYQNAVSIEEDGLGKHPLTTAELHRRISTCYRSTGQFNLALMSLRTALAIFIFDCGSDHINVISCLRELGALMKEGGIKYDAVNKYLNTVSYSVKYERYAEHLHGEGDFNGAVSEYQKAMSLEVAALGKDHLTEAALFKGIGMAYDSQGKYEKALSNCRTALKIYQVELGQDHGETSSTLDDILIIAKRQGLSGADIEVYEEDLTTSIDEEIKGDSLLISGERRKAIVAFQRAIALEEESLGQYHLCTSDLYSKIADTLRAMGELDRALVKYRGLLAVYHKPLGSDHPSSQSALLEINKICDLKRLKYEGTPQYGQEVTKSVNYERTGDDLIRQGLYFDSIKPYMEAIKIEKSGFGDSPLTSAGLFSKIADAYRLKGEHNRALLVYHKAIKIFQSHNIPEEDYTDLTMAKLVLAVQGLGFHETVASRYQKAVKLSLQHEGKGDVAFKSRNYDDAIGAYRLAIEAEELVLGKLPPTTSILYKKIGEICAELEDFESAVLFFSKALSIEESNLGKDSDETLKTFNSLLSVSQNYVADNGRHINGWSTLEYVLTALIGLLVVIATAVKSWSKIQRPIKGLKTSAYERSDPALNRLRRERIERTNGRGKGRSKKLEPPEEHYSNGNWDLKSPTASGSPQSHYLESVSPDGDYGSSYEQPLTDDDSVEEISYVTGDDFSAIEEISTEDSKSLDTGPSEDSSLERKQATKTEQQGKPTRVEESIVVGVKPIDRGELKLEMKRVKPIDQSEPKLQSERTKFYSNRPTSEKSASRLKVFEDSENRPSSIADRIKDLQTGPSEDSSLEKKQATKTEQQRKPTRVEESKLVGGKPIDQSEPKLQSERTKFYSNRPTSEKSASRLKVFEDSENRPSSIADRIKDLQTGPSEDSSLEKKQETKTEQQGKPTRVEESKLVGGKPIDQDEPKLQLKRTKFYSNRPTSEESASRLKVFEDSEIRPSSIADRIKDLQKANQ